MNKYELVAIVDAHKAQGEKDEVLKQITDSVAKGGGKVTNAQVWLDKHKMFFNIKKKNEGTYFQVNFDGASIVVAKIKEVLRINEEILRFMILKLE